MNKKKTMYKVVLFVLVMILAVNSTACNGDSSTSWQEQYDLGVRYLSEGNYEEAVIAFTAAIKIDSKQPPAYVKRGETYSILAEEALSDKREEAEEYLTLAQSDFEMALELDDSLVDAWLALSEVLMQQGEAERAIEVLQEAKEKTDNDPKILDKLDEAETMPSQEIVAEIEFDATDFGNYAMITAYGQNGDTLWSYETPQYEPAELTRVSEIGQKNDRYYFIQDSVVVALDIQTGAVVWENSDFGGSGTGVALGSEAIYLCGQYGPDFYAISYDGVTLTKIEEFDPNYFWASEIELLDEQAAVYLHGGTEDYNTPKVFYVDLETYGVSTGISMNSDESWKNAYVQFINEQEAIFNPFTGEREEMYKLVMIDGDGIPELYINFGTTAGGDIICTYSDNSVQSQYMWNYGFSYIEGQNLLLDSGGHMDEYYDIVYSIIDGKFVEQCHGEYGAEDNANITFDANGEIIYKYYWSDTPVTAEEYTRRLNSFFDKQRSISPFDGVTYDSSYNMVNKNGLCNYQEIIDTIYSY